MRAQRCFAIKAGVNGLLDVSRQVFCETYEEIQTLGRTYATDWGLPKLKARLLCGNWAVCCWGTMRPQLILFGTSHKTR